MTVTRNILIVDKHLEVIAALRRLLRKVPWQILATTSFQQSHALMRQKSVDLVICGLRDVTGADGTVFLQQIRDRFPGTIRIPLAGDVGDKRVIQGMVEGLFHEVIPIPWNSQELKEILIRAFQTRQDLAEEKDGLQQLFDQFGALPPMPHVYEMVRSELQKGEDASVDTVSDLILQDSTITAELLRVANVAFFGQRQQVDSVSRAVVLLGLDLVSHLVLFMGLNKTLKPKLREFEGEAFWMHSFSVGLAAGHAQARSSLDRRAIERAMVGGLLHDLGKRVFAHFMPERYAKVLAVARQRQVSLTEVEQELLGASHAQVGGYLAEQWNLPPSIVATIRWHHSPASSTKFRRLVEFVEVVDHLVRQLDIGFSGSSNPPEVDQCARQYRIQAEDIERARSALLDYKSTNKPRFPWSLETP